MYISLSSTHFHPLVCSFLSFYNICHFCKTLSLRDVQLKLFYGTMNWRVFKEGNYYGKKYMYISYRSGKPVQDCSTLMVSCPWLSDSRPLPDVALTGKCTRECDEYGHSDSCWMPVRTSPERKKSQPKLSTFMPVDERGSQEKLANGEAAVMGDRNRNLLNKKLTSSYETFSAASFSKNEEANPEDIPLTKTGEYKPSPVNTLTRREVYL